jgi:uncharacterized protein DUF3775
MANRPTPEEPDDTDADEALTVTPEQICFIIIKAREFDAKEADDEQDSGSNPSNHREMEVLEDLPDDPVQQEIAEFISAMNEDEQIDLVALAWLGRDPDNTLEDWPAIREEAANARASARLSTARYLLGIPTLGDDLEEGLSMFGRSCEDVAMGRL